MARRAKRRTMFTAGHPRLAGKQAVLRRLRRRDLVSVQGDGTVWVFPGAIAEPLAPEEREVIHALLGYTVPDPESPLIAKRAGVVGGRAVVAGTRIPVWRIEGLARTGLAATQLAEEFGLGIEQVAQALAYAKRYRDEIEQDLLDQGRVDRVLEGAALRWSSSLMRTPRRA